MGSELDDAGQDQDAQSGDLDAALGDAAGDEPDATPGARDAQADSSASEGGAEDAAVGDGGLDELDTLLVSGPPGFTPHAYARLKVSSPRVGATFTCALDGSAAAACEADIALTGLAIGSHELIVVAHDGEESDPTPLSVTWEVFGFSGAIVSSISVGYDHACVVSDNHELFCWGANDAGQLGLGHKNSASFPTQVGDSDDWELVACGREHTCGVRAGELFCWGSNLNGQAGLGNTAEAMSPESTGMHEVAGLAAGDYHSCALSEAGAASCFGLNGLGRLGDGSELTRTVPTAVSGGATFKALALGGAHSCGIRSDDQLACWGANQEGQLGFVSSETCPLGAGKGSCAKGPGVALGGGNYSFVAAGADFGCAVSITNDLLCWGNERRGVLGVPGALGGPTPIGVPGSWGQVSNGLAHSCGIKTDHSLWCWGRNAVDQLGEPSVLVGTSEPVPIGTGLDFDFVRAGAFGTCAVDVDGGLWCWGLGTFVQAEQPAWIEI